MSILVGYRPNPEGRAALERGATEARLRGAELLIARHVLLQRGDTDGPQRSEAAEKDLDQLRAAYLAEGLACRTFWTVGPSKASHQLLDLAGKERPELIVIGIRERSPVGKLILGSESQEILLHADAPVLAVKPDPADVDEHAR